MLVSPKSEVSLGWRECLEMKSICFSYRRPESSFQQLHWADSRLSTQSLEDRAYSLDLDTDTHNLAQICNDINIHKYIQYTYIHMHKIFKFLKYEAACMRSKAKALYFSGI